MAAYEELGSLPLAHDVATTRVHPRVASAGVAVIAVLVSIKHSKTYGKWVQYDGPWFGPTDGVKAVAGLSVLHVMGVYAAQRMRIEGKPWQCALAIVTHSLIVYAGTIINGLLTHRPGATLHAAPCTITVTFALWSASCLVVCTLTVAHKEAFWVAMYGGFLFTEHGRWTIDSIGTDVAVEGAVGLVLATFGAVVAIAAAFAKSPTPAHDVCYALGAVLVIGIRIACGFHIHHAEWPAWLAFPLRHHQGGWATGFLVGVMYQEIVGGDGYRVYCDGVFLKIVQDADVYLWGTIAAAIACAACACRHVRHPWRE